MYSLVVEMLLRIVAHDAHFNQQSKSLPCKITYDKTSAMRNVCI